MDDRPSDGWFPGWLLWVIGPVTVLAAALIVLALVLGLALLVDAAQRRTLMALPLAALAVLALAGVILLELSARGHQVEGVLVRYGYQLAIVAGVAILAVGLVGRIAEYRRQRDRELLARADTERRMQREAAPGTGVGTAAAPAHAAAGGPVVGVPAAADRLRLLLPAERCVVVAQA